LKGCRTIIGVDRFAVRLDLAVELGATHTINTSEGKDLVEVVKMLTDGGSSITIDTTGNPGLIESGMAVMANRGQVVVVGIPPPDYELKINLARYLQVGNMA
jgi:Zn-dependent alcohol dehydrogenase